MENLVLHLKAEFIGMQGNVSTEISELRSGFKDVQGEMTDIKILLTKLLQHTDAENILRSEGSEDKEDRNRQASHENSEEIRFFQIRIDLPSFVGGDPFTWLSKADQYFELHDTPTYNRLKIAHMCMEGAVVHWFKWIKSKLPSMTWEDFVEELIKRYRERKAANPYEMLALLRQEDRSID